MKTIRIGVMLGLAAATAAAAPAPWRFVNDGGVWWLQAAAGPRMLSRGVDCTGHGADPDAYDPAKPEYAPLLDGTTYDRWQARTADRFRAWGFNTSGGWTNQRFLKAGFPFTPVLHIGVTLSAPWWDPWLPEFRSKARDLAVKLVETTKGDPNRVGYFLDNEFGWSDDWMMDIALARFQPDQPGRAKLVESLKRGYRGDFRAFTNDFATTARGWDGLLSATGTGMKPGRGHRAMDAWIETVVRRYNVVLAGAVREADPGALILGDRYQQYYPQAVARAAKGVLDAVSTNFETAADGWVSPAYFTTLHELSGLPILVGEFYATARQNRSGLRNTGDHFTLVETQAQRARAGAAQVRHFAALPFVAGWHWFQWMDEPTYGRGDGEDYNMGLVDLRDAPYEEFTAAMAQANRESDAIHRESTKTLARINGDGAMLPLTVRRQDGLTTDGKIDEWDKADPVPRRFLKTEAPLRPFADVVLAWDPGALRIAVRANDFLVPADPSAVPADPKTWGVLDRLTVTVGDVTVRAAHGVRAAKDQPEGTWQSFVWAVPPPKGRPSAAIAAWHKRGLYTWEVAIPAAALGATDLAEGRTLSLSMLIENRGDWEVIRVDRLDLVLR